MDAVEVLSGHQVSCKKSGGHCWLPGLVVESDSALRRLSQSQTLEKVLPPGLEVPRTMGMEKDT